MTSNAPGFLVVFFVDFMGFRLWLFLGMFMSLAGNNSISTSLFFLSYLGIFGHLLMVVDIFLFVYHILSMMAYVKVIINSFSVLYIIIY